jgi:predicted acyltransferase
VTAVPTAAARRAALDTPKAAVPARLLSLDAFRGLTMAGMVIVNNPGSWDHVYAPLLHATWHGCTPTDLIFPFFLFIVGVAITLSRKSGGAWPIFRRAATLILLGWFLGMFPQFTVEHLQRLRIPGVLQRIGVCYFAAAMLYLWLRQSGPQGDDAASDRRVATVVSVTAAVLLVGYWGLLMLVPGGGGVPGDLTPDGNLGAVIDRAIFGQRLWKTTWDPEGLLSTVPALGTTLLGLLAGLWLRAAGSPQRVLTGLVAGGTLATLGGLAWSVVFPLNKALWTSSYALFTAGLGALLFAFCYGTIDVLRSQRWARPFVVLGSNAIALYVLSGMLAETLIYTKWTGADGQAVSLQGWLYRNVFLSIASPVNASLLFALAHLAVLYVVLLWMYKRGIFLKV